MLFVSSKIAGKKQKTDWLIREALQTFYVVQIM